MFVDDLLVLVVRLLRVIYFLLEENWWRIEKNAVRDSLITSVVFIQAEFLILFLK